MRITAWFLFALGVTILAVAEFGAVRRPQPVLAPPDRRQAGFRP